MPPATLQLRVPTFTPAGAASVAEAKARPVTAIAVPSIKRNVFMALTPGDNKGDSAELPVVRAITRGPDQGFLSQNETFVFNGLNATGSGLLRCALGADTA